MGGLNGDGNGDLRGMVGRLDHLEWLGMNGLWLNPISLSPNRDWGYDVSDYLGVDPASAHDHFDLLIYSAHRRGIAVILDVVPNETSDRAPVVRGCSPLANVRFGRRRLATRPFSGEAPTNGATLRGVGVDPRPTHRRLYPHNFSVHQPQLNRWNPDVAAEFDRNDGFRLIVGSAASASTLSRHCSSTASFGTTPGPVPTTPTRNVASSSASLST